MDVDAQELLTVLGRAVQRFGMYPAGHPARATTATAIRAALGPVTVSTPFKVEVLRDRMSVAGEETDAHNPLLAGLSRRLYEHQVRSLSFHPEVTDEVLTGLLERLSRRVDTANVPLGTLPAGSLSAWTGLRVEPLPFDAYQIREGEDPEAGSTPSPEIRTEGGAEEPPGSSREEEAATVRRRIEAMARAAGEQEGDPDENQKAVARLILELESKELQMLMEAVRKNPEGVTAEDVDSEAIARLLESGHGEGGQNAVGELIRLVTKMSLGSEPSKAQEATGDEADSEEIRELVENLQDWDLDNPNPQDYAQALQDFSKDAGTPEKPRRLVVDEPEHLRVLQMALELDEYGPQIQYAAEFMIGDGQVGGLIGLLEAAPETNLQATPAIWNLVARPEVLLGLLALSPVPYDAVDRLARKMGKEAADPMVRTFNDSESKSLRRELLPRLLGMGESVGPVLVAHLEDDRWNVRRDMLALMGRLGALPESFDPDSVLADPDQRVRREGWKLVLSSSGYSEARILQALDDADDQVIALGVEAAESHSSEAVIQRIIPHVLASDRPVALRIAGIRALGVSDSPFALATLLRLTWRRRFLFFGGLLPKSAEVLESVAALAGRWADDPSSARVLAAAGRSKDAQIRFAVRRKEEG